MDSSVLILGFMLFLIELMFIYFGSQKKFEIKVSNDVIIGIICTSYFFLPLTNKIIKYENLKKAFIREIKDCKGVFYDLLLEFSTITIILFRRKSNKKEMFKYCDKINHAIVSCESCIVEDSDALSKKTNILFVQILFLLVILVVLILKKGSYDKEILSELFCAYILATILFITLLIINLILNFINKKQENIL